MNRLFIALLLLGTVSCSLAHLHSEQTALQRTNAQLSVEMARRDRAIAQLQADKTRLAEAERTLRRSLVMASDITMKHQLNDQRSISRNEVLTHWRDAALPDGIIRLQQHPAFANPGDYLAWLSDRQQLRDPGKSAANTGGSADGNPPTGAGAADVRPASRNP